ncbi:hypothetical protein BDR06DRAFT_1008693 [Suillus hirtellus]|nr:hypothetical protein BDR06DRAFT_1008693 [Suillus hirtellus]
MPILPVLILSCMWTSITLKEGRGMEGQVSWMMNKKKGTTIVAAIIPSALPPVSVTSAPAIAAAVADLSSLMENPSFASIMKDESTCAINLPFTMILDSSTMVTLIKD